MPQWFVLWSCHLRVKSNTETNKQTNKQKKKKQKSLVTKEECNVLSKHLEPIKTVNYFFQLLSFPFLLGNVINKVNLFSQIWSVWTTEQNMACFKLIKQTPESKIYQMILRWDKQTKLALSVAYYHHNKNSYIESFTWWTVTKMKHSNLS